MNPIVWQNPPPPKLVWSGPPTGNSISRLNSYVDQYDSTMALYRLSESALWPDGGTKGLDILPPQYDEQQILKLFDMIRTSTVALRLWPEFAARTLPTVRIVEPISDEARFTLNGGARTDMRTREISFTRNGFALSKEAVLHELAHVIVVDVYGLADVESLRILGHGLEFARIYVKLLENFLDPAVARRLQDTLEFGSPYFEGVSRDSALDRIVDIR